MAAVNVGCRTVEGRRSGYNCGLPIGAGKAACAFRPRRVIYAKKDKQMPMRPHPTSFGVFKPVDHVLMSFASAAASASADSALTAAGFPAADIIRYTPGEMREQAESDIGNAGVLAGLGYELDLVKAQLALAQKGESFLVVNAPQQSQVELVTAVALSSHATRAQRYGSLIIEELLPLEDDVGPPAPAAENRPGAAT